MSPSLRGETTERKFPIIKQISVQNGNLKNTRFHVSPFLTTNPPFTVEDGARFSVLRTKKEPFLYRVFEEELRMFEEE